MKHPHAVYGSWNVFAGGEVNDHRHIVGYHGKFPNSNWPYEKPPANVNKQYTKTQILAAARRAREGGDTENAIELIKIAHCGEQINLRLL